MNTESAPHETYEISPRFRKIVEDRIARLERDAAHDEIMLATLEHEDHIRRHHRLIAVQRSEALRMSVFLERARTRSQRPLIAF